eukprot:COSAG06_NODE_2146_length_7479_cov_2.541057_1_plen_105_part_10
MAISAPLIVDCSCALASAVDGRTSGHRSKNEPVADFRSSPAGFSLCRLEWSSATLCGLGFSSIEYVPVFGSRTYSNTSSWFIDGVFGARHASKTEKLDEGNSFMR